MCTAQTAELKPANRLLAALSPNTHRRLARSLKHVELEFGQVLFEPGDAIGQVYFPNDCLVSLLVAAGNDEPLEVGMVGREGMVGLSVALGRSSSPVLVLVQGAGSAMRMSTPRFAAEMKQHASFRRQLDGCIYVAMTTAMQIAACNRSHPLAGRLARWLLMVRDRVGRGEFPLTQEFLARMLGVRRAGVTEAAGELQRRDLIRYSRGNVEMLDLPGIRAAACSCYRVIRRLEEGAR
jgi:CRP-like cAMP-binding protein